MQQCLTNPKSWMAVNVLHTILQPLVKSKQTGNTNDFNYCLDDGSLLKEKRDLNFRHYQTTTKPEGWQAMITN
jgi:hypothetical protein